MKSIAILVGAGKGKRIGLKDKAFLMLRKKPILAHSIYPFEECNAIDEIILVVRKNKINSAKHFVNKYKFRKVKKIIHGGKTRQDSVYNALKSIDNADYILVHDVARPLIDRKLIENVLNAAKRFGAAVPAVQCRKIAGCSRAGNAGRQFVLNGKIWLAQTPQAFKSNLLKKAYKVARKRKFYGSDDSSLVERIKQKVKIIKGNPKNIKITFPADLKTAEKFLKAKREAV